MTRFASVILVDRRGWVLLQERDEHARIAPDKWSYSGGHIEDGETELAAAVRELAEETGLRIGAAELELHGSFEIFHPETSSADRVWIYAAASTATDADIDCTEGRQIVFVDPARARALDLGTLAAATLPGFLDSELYARLAGSG